MHLIQIVSEGDNGKESTVGWTQNLQANSRSFSVSIATRKKNQFHFRFEFRY